MTEDAAQQQATTASQRTLAIWSAYEAGQLSRPDAEAAMATAVYVGKMLATRLADIHISTVANRPALGLTPGPQHLERLEQAVATVLDDEQDDEAPEAAAERLSRLAEAETLTSHTKSLRAAITGQGFTGYREQVADNACEVCEPFRDRLHPAADAWEPHHPRCRCSLVPVGQPESDQETERQPRRAVTIRRIA